MASDDRIDGYAAAILEIARSEGELERVGDELYVRGRFTEPGTMRETWRELAPQRGNKKLLGLIAMALTGALMLLGTRLTRDGLVRRG